MNTRTNGIIDNVIAAAIFGVLGSLAGWFSNNYFNPDFPVVSALFDNGSTVNTVDYESKFSGRYSSKEKNPNLWLFSAHISDPSSFHPYRVSLQNNNKFSSLAYFGNSQTEGSGETYILSLVQSTESMSKQIESYIQKSDKTGIYSGLKGIDKHINVLDVLNVQRK